jgi:putative transposase
VKANRGLTVARMVKLGRISRSSFYRLEEDRPAREDGDMELRDAIHRIALEWPSYGRPRITVQLRRQGWTVNHKRVRRLLREDNLLCLRKRKFVVTIDSNHDRKIYPNLAGRMTVTGLDQLWVADITYVRLAEEFIFLAVILDAYSRRVIGWALDRTMQEDLTLAALRMALANRRVGAALVHHSESGFAVRQQPVHRPAETTRHRHQHVAQEEPVGQRGLRIVHENLEVRGGVPQ